MRTSKVGPPYPPSATMVMVSGESRNKVRIEFHPRFPGQSIYVLDKPMSATLEGIRLNTTAIVDPVKGCLVFTKELHGDIVTRAWYSFSTAGLHPITIETFEMEE